ncbi:MAG: hypothetical protein M3083_16910 [Actinomycetota bacterium]|nr:hypothetical protein [Actinomycetota bacterium]
MDAAIAFEPAAVLKGLRSARRRQRIADFDPFEALYRAYLTGITVAMGVLLLSGATGDTRITGADLTAVRADGGAWVGMAVALAWAVGLRSGGRGGPLVVEAADVRHVLLAPVDRSVALRGPAIRQLRFLVLVGAATGGIAGLLALRRLPGPAAGWVASGAAAGALAVAGGFGLALLVSGRRLGRWIGGLLALLVLAWSGADLKWHQVTSPATMLGRLALWPLAVHALDLVSVVVALVALAGGLLVVGGTSLEASERRAGLVGQIRFAATLQDLRTVIVLRRQLAQELPRQRPWLRLPRSIPKSWLAPSGPGTAGGPAAPSGPGRLRLRRLPVWRRGWHGILRWPALRLARVGVLGAVAGVALLGVWNGTTPLIVVAGLALYLAALDVTEPLAQEVDHPDRAASFDLPAGELHLRQLGPSAVLMVLVGGVGLVAAAAATGWSMTTWQVGAIVVVPAAVCALGAGAMSVIKGPPPALSSQAVLIPEAAGARAIVRLLLPPIMCVLGVIPVVAARDAARHGRPILAAAASLDQLVAIVAIFGLAWVRYQEEGRRWWASQVDEAKKVSGRGDTA